MVNLYLLCKMHGKEVKEIRGYRYVDLIDDLEELMRDELILNL